MNALSFTPTTVSLDLGGAPISLETGRIAKQAHGAVIARQGGTMVLVAACHAAPREGIDFFPSPWTTANPCSRPARSPAAGSSAKAARR